MSIIVLIGASGSGKDTIGNLLQEEGIPQLISFTTRNKRPGEYHSKNYYFVNKEDIDQEEVIESTEYSGEKYGLFKKEVDRKLDNYKNTYFVSNTDGAQQIIDFYPNEAKVFWLDISIKDMKERMLRRGDSPENIIKRIEHAIDTKEIYPPNIKNLIQLDASKKPIELLEEILIHIN